MENKSLKVIQLGGNPLYLDEWLTYEYVTPDEMASSEIDEIPLLDNGRINSAFDAYRILVPHDSPLLDDFEFLKILHANNIVFDERIEIPAEYQQIAKLLNVQFVQMEDTEKLAEELILNFFQGQWGTYFDANSFRVVPKFDRKIKQIGYNRIRIEADYSEWRYIGAYGKSIFVTEDQQFEIMPEYSIDKKKVELEFHFKFFNPGNGATKTYKINSSDLNHGVYLTEPLKNSAFITMSVFVKGKGNIDLGHVHLRKSHNGRGFMMIGGENELVDPDLSQEMNFFFNAGDMKPPLNVYFSGYRQAPGFEGYYLLRHLGSPFILINDPRLMSGDFYIGQMGVNDSIPKFINSKIEELGFTNRDLVLTGASMGSFGALYYAADLKPKAVVVGKPLVHLGTIAAQSRIMRPDVFAESYDMLRSWTGGNDQMDIEIADSIFWDKFKHGDFSNTEFDFSYMKDDDYDKTAFTKLNKFLRKKFPKIRILYKGFIGRHNDQNSALMSWFSKQLVRIMEQDFGRKY